MGASPRAVAASLLVLTTMGCDSAGPSDARDAEIVRRDAPAFDTATDAYPPPIDAFCVQNEPDPDRAVVCSACEPRCFRMREQPRESGPAGGGLAYDETRAGLVLPHEADGSFVSEGRHQRVHDTAVTCASTEIAHWTLLLYQLDIPSGASARLRAACGVVERRPRGRHADRDSRRVGRRPGRCGCERLPRHRDPPLGHGRAPREPRRHGEPVLPSLRRRVQLRPHLLTSDEAKPIVRHRAATWASIFVFVAVAGCFQSGRRLLGEGEPCTSDADCHCPLGCSDADPAVCTWAYGLTGRPRPECSITAPQPRGEYCRRGSDCACPTRCLMPYDEAGRFIDWPVCGSIGEGRLYDVWPSEGCSLTPDTDAGF